MHDGCTMVRTRREVCAQMMRGVRTRGRCPYSSYIVWHTALSQSYREAY